MITYNKYCVHFLRVLIPLSFFVILNSCNKEEIHVNPSIGGFYRIDSLTSDIEVAIGNNRIVSNDLMEQIESFDFVTNVLEIRPNSTNYRGYNHKLITIPIPTPHVEFDSTPQPGGYVIYTSNSLNGNGYTFEFNESTKVITLTRPDNHQETEEKWGRLEDINVIDTETLRLRILKRYYDFKSAEWKALNLTAIYKKIY
jgi:hypothetical protein